MRSTKTIKPLHCFTTTLLIWTTAAALPAMAAQTKVPLRLGDKTLVAWVALTDLAQRGGSVLTIEKHGGGFDAIVFGELTSE